MNLYDVIPENLFSVLVSKNKNLYVKTLFVLLDAFKQHLKISKDELISMINARLMMILYLRILPKKSCLKVNSQYQAKHIF